MCKKGYKFMLKSDGCIIKKKHNGKRVVEGFRTAGSIYYIEDKCEKLCFLTQCNVRWEDEVEMELKQDNENYALLKNSGERKDESKLTMGTEWVLVDQKQEENNKDMVDQKREEDKKDIVDKKWEEEKKDMVDGKQLEDKKELVDQKQVK